ncbi:MAG: transposase [Candidatus Zixiibacteriota bacterium]
MGLRFPEQIFGSCFFLTTSFYDRQRLGDIDGVYAALANSLRYCLEKYSARLPGYVLMPSHIHLLLVLDGDKLGGFMRDFKKYTAQKALKDCSVQSDRVWRHRYDRVAVYSENIFRQKLEYIHNNPVEAGLVDIPEQWPWSSAHAYITGGSGPLPVWREWQM